MADQVGARLLSHTISTSGESDSLTRQVNQVAITNYHATAANILWARVETGNSAAAALTLADATDAVAAADETWCIPSLQRRVVFKSPKATYVALATIAAAASTTYTVEGTIWTDGQ